MEGSVAERLRVQERMIEAAQVQEGDPGWSAKVTPAGLQVTYTWRAMRCGTPGNFYTVESFVPWTTLARARVNPLLAIMDDLLKQKMEFKV